MIKKIFRKLCKKTDNYSMMIKNSDKKDILALYQMYLRLQKSYHIASPCEKRIIRKRMQELQPLLSQNMDTIYCCLEK